VSEIHEWLERLYGNSPGYFGITAFAGGRPRKTKWYATRELDAAERTIRQNADVADLYLSVATHSEPQETRGGEKTVLSIPGFWTDLDIGEFGHKPASLPNPSTEEEALSIVDGLPEPSMIMHSGGGLQGFWLFENGPWILDTQEEKDKAKKAIQEWGNLLEQQGKERGFHVDKIADLARILRVPGSINHKQGGYRPVVVRWADKRNHSKEKLIALGIPDPERPSYEEAVEGSEDKFPLTWNQILAPHGYKQCGETSWVRPGKNCDEGISLNVPEFAPYVITNFSESDPLIPAGRGTKLTKLKLYAILNHQGDVAKAEKALSKRKLKVNLASSITMKPVDWIWEGRIAQGTLALLAGREGIGKSTLAYTIAADITKGTLEGEFFGTPRSVIVVATEDDWEFTIVPRLNAAKADLTKVLQIEPNDPDEYGISLPRDIDELSEIAIEYDTGLILLDPLMSRLGTLDTHKDSDVRQALEPLVKMAGKSRAAVLGLIHVNKSGQTDPLNTLMGSRAFSAVSRAVLFVVQHPEKPDTKVMMQAKNNLGRSDLPDLTYTLQSVIVGKFEDRDIVSVGLTWQGELPAGSAREMINPRNTAKTKMEIAEEWLEETLTSGPMPSQEVKELAKLNDISEATLKRAFAEIGGIAKRQGHGKTMMSTWELPNPEQAFDNFLETTGQ
jgi:energy-coupling factor transporter ATP-binding protein EcfA2